VEVRRLLPVGELQKLLNEPGMTPEQKAAQEQQATPEDVKLEHDFEPSAKEVLGAILPHYLNYMVYQVLLEAKASEHSARMVAMKNATDNAKQIIKDLTLEYNKLRQANITKELLEITTAQMALG
jgi:F-type H+-transporting ATPase subunit gamma